MNQLLRIEEFRTALDGYRPSETAAGILGRTRLILLVAASASGRNTIIAHLLKTGSYHFIISDTTRLPRENNGVLEQNGREYWFRSEDEVLNDLRQGKFLEAEIIHGQQVSGISIRELQKACDDEKIAITDVDIGGLQNILKAKPDTVPLLVLPPDFAEWQHRLHARGEVPPDEFRRRMETASRIFAAAADDHRFTVVVNNNLAEAVMEVDHIAKGNAPDPKQQAAGYQLAHELHRATEELLEQLPGTLDL